SMPRPACLTSGAALCAALLSSGLLLAQATPVSTTPTPAVECPSDTTAAGRVCNAALDAATAMQPVAGLLISGGNPEPGTAGAQGKFGHMRLTARVGLAQVTFADTHYLGTKAGDTVGAAKRLTLPAPRLDMAMGIFSKKLPMGSVAVDLLGSVLLLPTSATTRIRVDPNARQLGGLALGFGYGFRAALVPPSPKPMVSISALRRDLPTLYYGNVAAGDNYSYASNLKAINVRLMVGARSKLLELSAGGGMDLYSGNSNITYHDAVAGIDSTFTRPIKSSRIMTAFNAAFNFPIITLSGELGFQVGKDEKLTTTFARNDTKAGKFYGGLGATIRL
ncbi:MAG: hypothetical protein ABJD11_06950, partial [Gemmatimonadota bacterium]